MHRSESGCPVGAGAVAKRNELNRWRRNELPKQGDGRCFADPVQVKIAYVVERAGKSYHFRIGDLGKSGDCVSVMLHDFTELFKCFAISIPAVGNEFVPRFWCR